MIKKSLEKYTYSIAVEELKIRNRNKNDPITISKNSLYYVQIIYFNPGCSITQISELIGVSKSAVTMKISKLVKDGLIYKKTSNTDKRKNFIYCSQSLISFIEQLDTIKKNIYKKIHEKYTEEEITAFCKILDDVSTNILQVNNKDYELNVGDNEDNE